MVKKRSPMKKIGFWFLIIMLVLFVAYPFAWMVSVSFRYDTDAFDPSIIPQRPTLNTYEVLLGFKQSVRQQLSDEQKELLEIAQQLPKDQREKILKKIKEQRKKNSFPFIRYFKNSLLLAGLSSFFSLMISIFGAYSFSRLKYAGRSFIQRGVLMVYLFGGTILAVPLYQIFVHLHMTTSVSGGMGALFLIYILQTLPVSLYMLGNYFRTISFSIEEAAIIDGCSRWGTIFRIIIPLSIPAIITVYIYAFMIGWNEYLFASIFLRSYPSAYTLPLGLSEIFNSAHAIWAKMMAASVLTAVPVVVLFISMEKYLTGGLTTGGVKE